MKKPGVILRLSDDRLVIVYNDQPLLVSNSKVVMTLIDGKYDPLIDENGKPKTILKDVAQYNLENSNGLIKLMGYID